MDILTAALMGLFHRIKLISSLRFNRLWQPESKQSFCPLQGCPTSHRTLLSLAPLLPGLHCHPEPIFFNSPILMGTWVGCVMGKLRSVRSQEVRTMHLGRQMEPNYSSNVQSLGQLSGSPLHFQYNLGCTKPPFIHAATNLQSAESLKRHNII